jgi:hypothetical protein
VIRSAQKSKMILNGIEEVLFFREATMPSTIDRFINGSIWFKPAKVKIRIMMMVIVFQKGLAKRTICVN